MFQGCPEHDFFSQPQLKFPMFVFSFTMFGVKDELLGRWCSQWQSVCFETRRTISGLCWLSSMWWTLVQVLLLPWTFLGALVKSLHVRLCTGIVVLQCLILQHLFCIWLKKINITLWVNNISLSYMREGQLDLISLKVSPFTCISFTVFTLECTSAALLNLILSGA